MTSKQIQNHRYLNALREGDRVVIEEIYRELSTPVSNFILANKGSREDAKDVFQETIMALILKLANEDLDLSGDFNAYFLAICRYKWLDRLKNRKHLETKKSMEDWVTKLEVSLDLDEMELQSLLRQEMEYQLYTEKLNELPNHCKEILSLSLKLNEENKKSHSLKEVAQILGKTYPYIRKAKSNCLKKLKANIKADARFHDLNK
mgnify:CR=1 FL=1